MRDHVNVNCHPEYRLLAHKGAMVDLSVIVYDSRIDVLHPRVA